MKRAVCILAWNRPRYLHLMLSGLSKCENLGDWDVYVYVDGSEGNEMLSFESLPEIPIDYKTIARETNIGNFENTFQSLRETFDADEYDAVLLCEDDFLLRPDILTVANTYLWPHIVMLRRGGHHRGAIENTGAPILFGRALFDYLWNWIRTGGYIGVWDVVREVSIPEDPVISDRIVGAFMRSHKIVAAFEPVSYGLHFGIRGFDYGPGPFGRDPEAQRMQKEIFKGHPSTWIGNVLELFAELDGSFPIHRTMRPEDFQYPIKELP